MFSKIRLAVFVPMLFALGCSSGGEALCSYALTPWAMYLRPEEFLL